MVVASGGLLWSGGSAGDLLNRDLRALATAGVIIDRLAAFPGSSAAATVVSSLEPPVTFQVITASDVSVPLSQRVRERAVNSSRRLLKLLLSDGFRDVLAIEVSPTPALNNLRGGAKLLFGSSPLEMSNGLLLIRPGSVTNLGGEVKELHAAWIAAVEASAQALTGGPTVVVAGGAGSAPAARDRSAAPQQVPAVAAPAARVASAQAAPTPAILATTRIATTPFVPAQSNNLRTVAASSAHQQVQPIVVASQTASVLRENAQQRGTDTTAAPQPIRRRSELEAWFATPSPRRPVAFTAAVVSVQADLSIEGLDQYLLPVAIADASSSSLHATSRDVFTVNCVMGDTWLRKATGVPPVELRRWASSSNADDLMRLQNCVGRVSNQLENLGSCTMFLVDELSPPTDDDSLPSVRGPTRRIRIADVTPLEH